MNRIFRWLLIGLILLLLIALGVNKYDPYLRTDIFRSFAQGNTYITSESDTLYSIGWYGVKKYLANSQEDVELLAENSSFLTGRIVGRCGLVDGDFLYLVARSFLPGHVDTDGKKGVLVILKKADLSIVKTVEYSDLRPVEVKMHGKIIAVSGVEGFTIYEHSSINSLKEISSFRRSTIHQEYQGFDFIEKHGSVYIAFAQFGRGLEIWDITTVNKPEVVCHIPLTSPMVDGSSLPTGLQSRDVLLNYPYLYATLAPKSYTFGEENDRRGLLVYDISDFNNIKKEFYPIPQENWYKKGWFNRKSGDPSPNRLVMYGDTIFANFWKNGVAVYDVSNAASPVYRGNMDVSRKKVTVSPIHVTSSGTIYAGDYYWSTLYAKNLKKELNR